MEGLQRSSISFRRQGSSGLVWENRFLSGELKKNPDQQQQQNHQPQEEEEVIEFRELRTSRSMGSAGKIERNRSTGRDRHRKVSPEIDPPSPKISGCGFCTIFGGKPSNSHPSKIVKERNPHQ